MLPRKQLAVYITVKKETDLNPRIFEVCCANRMIKPVCGLIISW